MCTYFFTLPYSLWAPPCRNQLKLCSALRACLFTCQRSSQTQTWIWILVKYLRSLPEPKIKMQQEKDSASTSRAEVLQWPQLGAGAFSSFLWPPCAQLGSGRTQTKPLSLSLIGLTSSAFQNRKLSAARNSCFFAIIFEKQTFFPCTYLFLFVVAGRFSWFW